MSWIWLAIISFSLVFAVPEFVAKFKNNSEQEKLNKEVADYVSTKDFSAVLSKQIKI